VRSGGFQTHHHMLQEKTVRDFQINTYAY
jgi:hypothetical protein